MWKGRTTVAAAALCAAIVAVVCQTAAARGFSLELPVDCILGEDCLVFQYYDQDPTPGRRDVGCGRRTYDGHDGTDIRAMTLADMRRGVPVVAAAPGVVRAVRDGMDDVDYDTLPEGAVKGREAGNAVVLIHEGGYETQYSHLRKGSVAVEPGQRVRAGTPLGFIGMSGMAAFPHVEFVVRRGLVAVDPYTGAARTEDRERCGMGPDALWSPAARELLAYRAVDVLDAGFAARTLTMPDVERGMRVLRRLRADAPVVIFWAWLGGVADGDELRLEVRLPDGRVLAQDANTVRGYKVQYLAYAGVRRAEGARWPSGTYRGTLVLRRPDADGALRELVREERTVRVP